MIQGTFSFTRLTFKMNNMSELNKYNKKTPELQKKRSSVKTEQKKDHRAVWGGLLLHFCLFPS